MLSYSSLTCIRSLVQLRVEFSNVLYEIVDDETLVIIVKDSLLTASLSIDYQVFILTWYSRNVPR